MRAMMRGYARLKAQGRLGTVAAIREELTVTRVGDPARLAAPALGLGGEVVERALRQALIIRHLPTALPEALYRSAGTGVPVAFSLPYEWRQVLWRHGFEVAGGRCALLWAGFAAMRWANGLRVLLKQVAACLSRHNELPPPPAQYAYFDGLTRDNLPGDGPDPGRDGVFGWYSRWTDRTRGLDAFVHSVKAPSRQYAGWTVQHAQSPLPLLGRGPTGRLLARGLWESAVALAELTAGRWQRAVGLAETVRALHMALAPPQALARDYLFHNSNWVWRPLWTHVAKERGSRILFYFYSTNIEKLQLPGVTSSIPYGWKAGSWPVMLAWDETQRNFLKRCVDADTALPIVGPVDFLSARGSSFELAVENAIAVFDVQPQRDALYRRLGIDFEYYVPAVANGFIRELTEAADGAGCTLVLKRKRDIGHHLHPAYSRHMRLSVKPPVWIEVPPETNALDLIRSCKAVISMPYTSTAVVARHQGKPSVYYDSSRRIARGDPAAHGIPILQSPEELKEWILAVAAPREQEVICNPPKES